MMRRRFFALLLVLVLLLQGCGLQSLLPGFDDLPTPENTGFTPTFLRPYDPLLEPVAFSQLTYERPDSGAPIAALEALTAELEAGGDLSLNDVLTRYCDAYDEYVLFETMTQLAYILYTLDLNDTARSEEYNLCSAELLLLSQALESCYIAMAASPLRTELEDELFGEGFFLDYDSEGFYSDDRVVELLQRDSELQSAYLELLLDESSYEAEYNAAAEIFIELLRVRREIAQALDYDSYAQFAYDFYYDRDYTPEQAERYTADIAECLPPLLDGALSCGYYVPMRAERALRLLDGAAHSLGREFAEVYDYMVTYELYDISDDAGKMGGSYTTYLEAYEMPYLFLSPTGSSDDLLTAAHEFGHFVDAYVNCNMTVSTDCAEIFSNALEYLMLDRFALTDATREALTASKLADSLFVFLSQACYAEFERRVYALPDEDLTAERLGEVFAACCADFGLADLYGSSREALEKSWVLIHHFYIAPFYVISYCVSEDAALRVYQCELEDGSGLDTYLRLLYRSAENTFVNLLDEAELGSPFDSGRMEELQAFYAEAFARRTP